LAQARGPLLVTLDSEFVLDVNMILESMDVVGQGIPLDTGFQEAIEGSSDFGEDACKRWLQPNARKGGRQHEDLQLKYGGLDEVPADQVTTLMIRNLPRRYTEEALLYELEAFTTPNSYNFLYLPWDSRRSSNVGYAFVNFIDASTASSLRERLNGKPWRLVQTPKEIKILPAHVQVVHGGQRISFHKAVEIYCPQELIRKHYKETGHYTETTTSPAQAALAQISTQSSLYDMSVSELEQISCQASCPQDPRDSVLLGGAGPFQPGASRMELTQLLASENYLAAWKKLNHHLQVCLMMYKVEAGSA